MSTKQNFKLSLKSFLVSREKLMVSKPDEPIHDLIQTIVETASQNFRYILSYRSSSHDSSNDKQKLAKKISELEGIRSWARSDKRLIDVISNRLIQSKHQYLIVLILNTSDVNQRALVRFLKKIYGIRILLIEESENLTLNTEGAVAPTKSSSAGYTNLVVNSVHSN